MIKLKVSTLNSTGNMAVHMEDIIDSTMLECRLHPEHYLRDEIAHLLHVFFPTREQVEERFGSPVTEAFLAPQP